MPLQPPGDSRLSPSAKKSTYCELVLTAANNESHSITSRSSKVNTRSKTYSSKLATSLSFREACMKRLLLLVLLIGLFATPRASSQNPNTPWLPVGLNGETGPIGTLAESGENELSLGVTAGGS